MEIGYKHFDVTMLEKISNRFSGNDNQSRKIVIRRLPPQMDEETFKRQISPIPEHDYMYFVEGDKSYGVNSFSRAYINFVYEDDLYLFKERFDNYVFLDGKGVEYRAVVEFAPFLRIPKERPYKKKDIKAGTIEACPYFQDFLRNLQKCKESLSLGFQVVQNKKIVNQPTPLLKYLSEKKKYKNEKWKYSKGFKDRSCVFVNSSVKKRFL